MKVVELGSNDSLCREACECLCEEWPGISLEMRLERIQNKKEGRTFGLLLESNDNSSECVGCARIQNAAETGEGMACAITSVVISTKHRGKGYGKELMSGLEEVAKELNYTYIYLWTSTAKGFYEKCGYMFCQRINLDKPVLRKFNQQAILALESMLSQRQNKMDSSAMDNIDNPREGENVTWMRKRLVQELPSQSRDNEELHSLISSSCESLTVSELCFTYHCVNVPWQRQVGPSCGLAALRMVKEYYNQQLPSDAKTLLETAVERSYSADGEIFNINNLERLAVDVLLFKDAYVLETTTDDIEIVIKSIIDDGKLIVFPYDRNPGTSLPALYNGVYSHYCVFFGYGFLNTGSQPCIASTESIQEPGPMYLLSQHSMSNIPLVDLCSKWIASNNNLNPSEKTTNKFTITEGQRKVANLAGKCLVI